MRNYRLDFIVFFNSETQTVIILDYDSSDPSIVADIGYEVEPEYDWETKNEEIGTFRGFDLYFDTDKAFSKTGIYKVHGYDTSCSTPDGYYEGYEVDQVEFIQEVKY